MTKQEEAREGIAHIFELWANGFEPLLTQEQKVARIMSCLHSQGVVIRGEQVTAYGIPLGYRVEPLIEVQDA